MIEIDSTVRGNLAPEEIQSLENSSREFDALIATHGRHEFKPFAYYDQSLDCIRVVVEDCGACEFRINEWLTVLHSTDPESPPAPIGFTMKGVSELMGGHTHILDLTKVFDALAKVAPNEMIQQWVFILRKLTRQKNVYHVDMGQAA